MRILDTHLHLIDTGRFVYPWIKPLSHLARDWSAEQYFFEAEGLGIERALHMEVDVAEPDMLAETAHVLTVNPRVVGAIAACRPELPGFEGHIESLLALNGVKGVRRILHEAPDDLSDGPLFTENLRRLAPLGLTFDFCLRADQLPIGVRLANAAPDTQFVLDHCGVPDVAGRALDPWRSYIANLAELPNVAAKISGIVAYARPDWSVDDLRPFVEHVIACFGWDRVVWGSDHPVCTRTASLTRWVAATHEIVAGASADEKAKLLHRNAERIYRV